MKALKTPLAALLAFCWLVQARVVHVGVTSKDGVTIDIEAKSEGRQSHNHGKGVNDNSTPRAITQGDQHGPNDVDLGSFWHRGFPTVGLPEKEWNEAR